MHSHCTTVKTRSLKSVWKKTVTCSWRRSQHFVDWTGYHESIHGDLYRPSTVLQLFHYLWLHQRSTVSDVQRRSLDRRRPLHKNNINDGCTSCAKKWTYVSYGTIIYNVVVGLSNDAVKRCGCMFKFKFKVACLVASRCPGKRLSTWPTTAVSCPTALGARLSAVSWRFDLRGASNTQQLWRQNFCCRRTSPVELSSSPTA